MNALTALLARLKPLWDRTAPIRPWLLRLVGYPVFFVFWFVVFVYITFPYDRLKETIIAAAEAPSPAPGATQQPTMRLRIGSLGPTLLPGISARDVSVTFLPERPTDQPVTMQLDRVSVHVGLLSLLFGTVNASANIRGLGGEIDVDVSATTSGTRPGVRDLKVEFEHVSLAGLPPVAKAVGLPVMGALDGTFRLEVPEGRINRATGRVALTVDDLRVGDGRSQFEIPNFGGVTIEQIRAGQLTANLNIRDGVATVERIAAQSNEFTLAMEGRVELREDLQRSNVNLGLRFSLTDAYRTKSETSRRIMMVFDMAPPLQQARRGEGQLGFRCRGTFAGDMRCLPDGTPGGAGGGRGPGGGLPGLPRTL